MNRHMVQVTVFGVGIVGLGWVVFNNWWGPAACLGAYLVGTAIPSNPRREDLNEYMDNLNPTVGVGQSGIAVTDLRPAGKAAFDGSDLVDVVSDTPAFISRGSEVEVVRKQGNRVVVRALVGNGEVWR